MHNNPDILMLVGSPHTTGRSTELAGAFAEAFREHGIKPTFYHVAQYPVAACNNCGSCRATGECAIMGDGFNVLAKHIDSCDAAIIVAPVYFAGPSGWLKAVFDRCQVYWSRRYVLGQGMPRMRPAHLVVVGDGGDPFGYEPLVTIAKSALNSTGLRIDDGVVYDFVAENYDFTRIPVLVEHILEGIS